MTSNSIQTWVKSAFMAVIALLFSVWPAVSDGLSFHEVTGRTIDMTEEVPDGQMLVPGSEDANDIYIVRVDTILPQGAFADAYASLDQNGAPGITVEFTPEASAVFSRYTADNVGKTVAIIFDGEVLTAPRIMSEIISSVALITGSFTTEEAVNIAEEIKSGADFQD